MKKITILIFMACLVLLSACGIIPQQPKLADSFTISAEITYGQHQITGILSRVSIDEWTFEPTSEGLKGIFFTYKGGVTTAKLGELVVEDKSSSTIITIIVNCLLASVADGTQISKSENGVAVQGKAGGKGYQAVFDNEKTELISLTVTGENITVKFSGYTNKDTANVNNVQSEQTLQQTKTPQATAS